MRAVRVLLLGILAATGCKFLDTLGVKPRPPADTANGILPDRPAGDFVSYLNAQAAAVQSIRFDDVSVKASDQGNDMPRLGEGVLVCAKPRNFRMIAGHVLTSGTEVDLGSNSSEFWMYVKRPQQTFIYCSHEDFSQGKANLPIPFETDWVLEALGMAPLDPNLQYAVETNQKERVYTLTWESKTPQGEPIRKTTVFAGDRASADRPQVVRHVVTDANRKVIATADVREVRPTPVGDTTVLVPTRVALEWPQQKFKMDLTLGRPSVNGNLSQKDFDYFFKRPTISGANPINLAAARYTPSSYRGATPGDARPRVFGSR